MAIAGVSAPGHGRDGRPIPRPWLPECSGASRVPAPGRGDYAALDPPSALRRPSRAGDGRTEPPAGARGTGWPSTSASEKGPRTII
jgi:hypothetical protein